MADFTPILIADNAGLRQQKTNDFATVKIALASLVTLFNSLQYTKDGEATTIEPLANTELEDMLNNPQTLIVNKMTDGEGVSVGGLKAISDRAFEIIEKPIGYDGFISALELLKARFKNSDDLFYSTCSYNDLSKHFAIDNEGEVINSASLTTMLNALGKVYTSNESQNAMYQFIESLFESFKENIVDAGCSFKRHTGGQGVETFKYILTEYISSCNPAEGTFAINTTRFSEVK